MCQEKAMSEQYRTRVTCVWWEQSFCERLAARGEHGELTTLDDFRLHTSQTTRELSRLSRTPRALTLSSLTSELNQGRRRQTWEVGSQRLTRLICGQFSIVFHPQRGVRAPRSLSEKIEGWLIRLPRIDKPGYSAHVWKTWIRLFFPPSTPAYG